MKKPNLSAKRIAIDKANARIILTVGIATFVVVFSAVGINALYKQLTYQSKVISAKKTTLKQVKQNIQEVDKLKIAYAEFSGATTNVLGGNPSGSGDRDGDNARIILDALPGKYDFPALATSMDKLLKSGGFTMTSFEGSDDEIAQVENKNSTNPTQVEINFSLDSEVNPADTKRYMELFERSIRPIQLQKVSVTGFSDKSKITISAKTFYQPEKQLNVTEEVVK